MTRGISDRSLPRAFSAWRSRFLPSNRRLLTSLVLITSAAIVGAIGWSGEVLLLPVACLFPALWAFAPTRLVAALVSMAYFMASSRGLPAGVSIFYASDIWVGLGLWVSASLLFVTVHTVLWSPKAGWHRPLRYLMAWTLMSVPPFGIVGWASPITAAGVLLPGWGWAGLAATAASLSAITTRAWPLAGGGIGVAFALSAFTWTDPQPPEGWVGIDTTFDYQIAGEHADYARHVATIELVRRALEEGATTIVLPESVLGIWTPTTERLWVKNLGGLGVIVAGGAVVINERGYDNVMIEVTGEGARTFYRERMPVPVSMWRPWASGGASAQFFGNPIGRFAGRSIAPLICYEQLIVWPILQSMLFDPEVIAATGNGWWVGDTNIVAIQKANAMAWASLFSLPLVIAFNT
ncbi:MAG: conjugal transfer protein TraB [Rhizobiaceae bacterium]|nr:conjugal transfer protein TraB [Rhizobiaceae bacterium]